MREPGYANNEDYADGRGFTPNNPPESGSCRWIDSSGPAKFTFACGGCQRGPERKSPEIKAFFHFCDGLQRLGEVDRKRAADCSPLPVGGEGRKAPKISSKGPPVGKLCPTDFLESGVAHETMACGCGAGIATDRGSSCR